MNYDQFEICPIVGNITSNESISIGQRAEDWYDKMWQVKDCPTSPKCNRTIYKMEVEKEESTWSEFKASLKIQLESPNVQNVIDSHAYDLQSLIGEVGGTLGLFLGLSTYSFVEFVEYLINKLSC